MNINKHTFNCFVCVCVCVRACVCVCVHVCVCVNTGSLLLYNSLTCVNTKEGNVLFNNIFSTLLLTFLN